MATEHDGDGISGREALRALRRVATDRSRELAQRVVRRATGSEPVSRPRILNSRTTAPPAEISKVPAQRVGSWDLRLADHDLAWIHRLDVQVDPALLSSPRLNVLIPGIRQQD